MENDSYETDADRDRVAREGKGRFGRAKVAQQIIIIEASPVVESKSSCRQNNERRSVDRTAASAAAV